MSSRTLDARTGRLAELRKLQAFFRRDILVSFSYRLALVTDWVNLFVQVAVLGLVGKLIPPSSLPSFGGQQVTYLEYVTVGIAVGSFVQLGLRRVQSGVRAEQLMGTLESILVTPTDLLTIQIGWVIYDVVYVPVRTVVFLLAVWLVADVGFTAGGVLPAITVLFFFIPFVWGLGVISAAGSLTFRRGAGIGFIATALTLTSGAYFPLTVLPSWMQQLAKYNPIAIAVTAMRSMLLGNGGWDLAFHVCVILIPWAIAMMVAGVYAFRIALRRERQKGTTSLY